MAEPPLEHRVVLVHRPEQLAEVHEYSRVARVQGPLVDAQHSCRHPAVLSMPPLDLEAHFLLFGKHHAEYVCACESYNKIRVCVTFTTKSPVSRLCVISPHTHTGACQ